VTICVPFLGRKGWNASDTGIIPQVGRSVVGVGLVEPVQSVIAKIPSLRRIVHGWNGVRQECCAEAVWRKTMKTTQALIQKAVIASSRGVTQDTSRNLLQCPVVANLGCQVLSVDVLDARGRRALGR
jgi:hypothetical protein